MHRLQLSERATDDSDETAWIINEVLVRYIISILVGLTFAGDTSGIITKGIGPRPTAKDLHEKFPFRVNKRTYEIRRTMNLHHEGDDSNTRKH